MNIQTKFDVGQTVWHVYQRYASVPCNICEGTGWVELKGTDWLCPCCRGGKTTIVPGCYLANKEKVNVIQVGPSGVLYNTEIGAEPEEEFFPTEEAAQAEADRLNTEAGR